MPLENTNVKPFKCLQTGCNASFSTSTALSKHLKKHTGEKNVESVVGGSMKSPKLTKLKQVPSEDKSANSTMDLLSPSLSQKELEDSVSCGNYEKFKDFVNCLVVRNEQVVWKTDEVSSGNQVEFSKLFFLACERNQIKIASFLLDFVKNLPTDKIIMLPADTDEFGHNAFYYAIRSGDVNFIQTLINEWPSNYFSNKSEKLDEILSLAYDELKLKNVTLTDKMHAFVIAKLINIRFFSNATANDKKNLVLKSNIEKRIDIVIDNIEILYKEYSSTEKIDERFLYISNFISCNIHILKRLLKSTYKTLPWEEIEFCLISFVSSYTKTQEINMFYNATLNKIKIINYLHYFSKILHVERFVFLIDDVSQLAHLPNISRDRVVVDIIKKYPFFEELYDDFQQIRDISSLDQISDYLSLASSADPEQKEGQLVITRVLQAVGEHLKNTLESPKLSSSTSDLLLLSLPKNTRKVMNNLRNSLSHAGAHSIRREVEEKADLNFFVGIKSDLKKILSVVLDTVNQRKVNIIITLLQKFEISENIEEMKQTIAILNNAELDKMIIKNPELLLCQNKLKKLVKRLSNEITDKTSYELDTLSEINDLIHFTNTNSNEISHDFAHAFVLLKHFDSSFEEKNIDNNSIRILKYTVNKSLKNISRHKNAPNLEKLADGLVKILNIVRSRLPIEELDKVLELTSNIYLLCDNNSSRNLNWLEGLQERLSEKSLLTNLNEQKRRVHHENIKIQLELKVSELERVLKLNKMAGQNTTSYKREQKLLAVIEMLVLDILTILGLSDKYLENNIFFLDDSTPLLTGKCLRNHLAHGNGLVDVLLTDPTLATICNAKNLNAKMLQSLNRKVGKFVEDNPLKLIEKHNHNLLIIENQQNLFHSIESGNFEKLKNCLRKGGDIFAKSTDLSTCLHFAARGPSIEVVKYLTDQNLNATAKDVNGKSPLHIAAVHGRCLIIEFLIKEKKVNVDSLDKLSRTPLHLAAKSGVKESVDILLKHKADSSVRDIFGFSPLHYAVKNNHKEITMALLNKESSFDSNEVLGGFSVLHVASERGRSDLANYFLDNGSNANAKTDRGATPLHLAALNGHSEIVNSLIRKGADINARVVDGCTPLHYAVETGRTDIVHVLLSHGACVNIGDKTSYYTPLHYACKDGHDQIVNNLLAHEACVNDVTVDGRTPLHEATQGGRQQIVQILLKHNVDIRAKDNNLATALHIAAESGSMEVTELLLRSGAEINDRDINNRTALHIAALKGNANIVELLIKHKSDVRAKDNIGRTALHLAAQNGNCEVIDYLLKCHVEVNAKATNGMTPLHHACLNGQVKAAELLLINKAKVNAEDNMGVVPLVAAVAASCKEIVNILIENKADVSDNVVSKALWFAIELRNLELFEVFCTYGASAESSTLLHAAIRSNQPEMVKILLKKGANVNADHGEPLRLATYSGSKQILDILLDGNANINLCHPELGTPLFIATVNGHYDIVNALIQKGADVNCKVCYGLTPLHIAAKNGHTAIVKTLIANNADANISCSIDGTALHLASALGHVDVVNILLKKMPKINVKDQKNRTPLELAVANGHLPIVKVLIQQQKGGLSGEANDNWSILHIASQFNNLEMVKFLVEEGCDIYAKNQFGSMPMHIAAREGFVDTVEFFLSKGLSINERGCANQTILHYAAIGGSADVLNFLIKSHQADVNAKDDNGHTPLHIAAKEGKKEAVILLMEHGADYKIMSQYHMRPLEVATNKDIINILSSTGDLFDAVTRNCLQDVKKCLEMGAFINAKTSNGGTPLHFAAWKGFEKIVQILLSNKANPNEIGSKGFTPLHYAAKFSHLKCVITLLSHGAMYDRSSDSGKTAAHITENQEIAELLKLISEYFIKVKKRDVKVMNSFKQLKDIERVKAIFNARNNENQTLIVAAINSHFPNVDKLKQVMQEDLSAAFYKALMHFNQGQFQQSLGIFKIILNRRMEIFGPNNPATMEIQKYLAQSLYKLGNYNEALSLFEDICKKQGEELGFDHEETLEARSLIALVLHRLHRNEEAYEIFKEVYPNQTKILGALHSNTVNSLFHMALVLDKLGKYDEALKINRDVYEIRKSTLGAFDPSTVSAQNNIAMVLSNKGSHEEALEIYQEVLEKKRRTLGAHHVDTLRTINLIGALLMQQEKFKEALTIFEELLQIQKEVLPQNHPETLTTKNTIGNILLKEGKYISALKVFKQILDVEKAIFGRKNAIVIDTEKTIKAISMTLKLSGSNVSEVLQHLQTDIIMAASQGDTKTFERLWNEGADVNDFDIDGRTPLHYAVSYGHGDMVKVLLSKGASATHVTNKGNTTLHTATSKGFQDIIKVLLKNVGRDKIFDFINARTTSGGTTALHVAAKNGNFEIVKCLLMHGATFCIKNKEGKSALDISTDKEVINILKSTQDLFQLVNMGSSDIISKIKLIPRDTILAISNARNNNGRTLLQSGIANKNKYFAEEFLKILKQA